MNSGQQWLMKHGKGGSTGTCNDQRKGVSVVKGIHPEYTPEEVKQWMEEYVNFQILHVRHFEKEPKASSRTGSWWVITTDTKEQALTLKRTIKTFGSLRSPIYWEQYESNRTTRCFRCQKYRHLSKNCLFPPRCALCAKKHLTDDCTLTFPIKGQQHDSIYKCVNCDNKGHWAGSQECPLFLREANIAAARMAERRTAAGTRQMGGNTGGTAGAGSQRGAEQRVPRPDEFIRRGKEERRGPQAVTNPVAPAGAWRNKGEPEGNNGNLWDEINKGAEQLFGRTTASLMDECIRFKGEFAQMETEGERRTLNSFLK